MEEGQLIRPQQAILGKRSRDSEEFMEPEHRSDVSARIRFIRVKDVGTRLYSVEQRNQRIIELAHPLPEGNRLRGRAIYWLVTTEQVLFTCEDTKLFLWQESIVVPKDGVIYYLTQFNFVRNKHGLLAVHFTDGSVEFIECYSTKKKTSPNKRAKLTTEIVDEDSQTEFYQRELSANAYNNDNTNQLVPELDAVLNSPLSSTPLFVNIMMLVPDKMDYIKMIDEAMTELEFIKEVESSTNLRLYSQTDRINIRHYVLVFPYGNSIGRITKIPDYLMVASEVILLLENDEPQQEDLMAIKQVTNVNNNLDDNWDFTVKDTSLKRIELDHRKLNRHAGLLFSIKELRQTVLGGASWRSQIDVKSLKVLFQDFFLQWILLGNTGKNQYSPSVYLCFKYEPKKVKAFTEYAWATLQALGIDYDIETIVVHGSVLVYIQCPSYTRWLIQMNKEEIFYQLSRKGLTEIYECFLSDVEHSMQRPNNEEFVEQLSHLTEMMICDGIADTPLNRFSIKNPASANNSIQSGLLFKGHEGLAFIQWEDIMIGKFIGCGSTSEVFQAQLRGSTVALKKFNNCKDDSVLKEASILMSLHHKHIVPIYGVSRDPCSNEVHLIMKFMENGSLEDVLFGQHRHLEKDAIIQIALDIAKGLQYLHSRKIIHRDLKCSNVLLYKGHKRAKISDFGSARYVQADDEPKTVIGTLLTLAPEILSEQPYNEKVDVYSFGVILYEMCTNRRLHILEETERRKLIVDAIHDLEIQRIIQSCSWTDPIQRPSMVNLCDWLQRLQTLPAKDIQSNAFSLALRAISQISQSATKMILSDLDDTGALEDLNKADLIDQRVVRQDSKLEDKFNDLSLVTVQTLELQRISIENKLNALRKFDGKFSNTVEDYDSDRLKRQLFGPKTEILSSLKTKFAVRVFVSSASAGMATNVAKLMRQFNGKSIVDGVHAGLQIANTIVEWNQSSLVHIGELKHTSATAVLFDVQDSVKFEFNDDIAGKMINFIQRWNTEHVYSVTEYNSHRFVRDFLQETLNMTLVEQFKGPLGLYMDYVMNTGDVTPRLISKSHGTMVFKTHQELEEAEKQIRGELSTDEIKLLKIFHRGFQLQEAAHGKDVSSCCYGLPTNGLEILNDSGKPMKY